MSNQLPDDALAAGPQTTLGVAEAYTTDSGVMLLEWKPQLVFCDTE